MPSVSPAQARLMRAISHGWKKPGGGGPSVSVAKEFTAADKAMNTARKYGKKYADGGDVFIPPVSNPDAVKYTPEGYPYYQAGPEQKSSVFGENDVVRSQAEALPERPPTRMQPDLLSAQQGHEDIPEGYAINDGGIMFNKQTGEEVRQTRRPGVLPITRTPEGQYEWAMPKAAELAGNVMSPLAAPSVATKAGEVVLGSGAVKTSKAGSGASAMETGLNRLEAQLATHESHQPLDISGWKVIGDKEGTQQAKWMQNPETGEKRYVKIAQDAESANREKLGAELYKLFGVPVADVRLTTFNGRPAIASKKIEGYQLSHAEAPYNTIEGLHEGFPADAVLNHWDSVGVGPENRYGNVIIDKNGVANRIDTAGVFDSKGTGGKKAFSLFADALHTMRDPDYNLWASKVFGDLDHAAALRGAQKIAQADPGKIADLVGKYGPQNPKAREDLLTKLLSRREDVIDHYGVAESSHEWAATPKGSTADELEQLIKSQKHDDAEYWAKLEQDQMKDYGGTPHADEMGLEPLEEFNPFKDTTHYDPVAVKQMTNEYLDQIRGLTDPSKPHGSREADRVKGGFTTPAYKGLDLGTAPVERINHPSAGFSSDSIDLAHQYAVWVDDVSNSSSHFDKPSDWKRPAIQPLWLDTRDYVVVDAGGKTYHHGNQLASDMRHEMEMKGKKPKGAIIKNVYDRPNEDEWTAGSGNAKPATVYWTWDQSTRRSRFADFNPKNFGKPGLLGGIAGFGLVGLPDGQSVLIKQGDDKSKMKRGGRTKEQTMNKIRTSAMSKTQKAIATVKKYAKGGPGMADFHQRNYRFNIGTPPSAGEPGVGKVSAPVKPPHVSNTIQQPHVGMIHSAIPGRTDKIPMGVKGGSYVVPADVVSGIGQGNSIAGAAAFNNLFKMGPYGANAGKGVATPKVNYGKLGSMPKMIKPKFEEGGEAPEGGDPVPIIAAGGEYVIPPQVVQRLGGGDMTHGHSILDALVLHLRAKTIKDMKGLKPPKRS